MTFDDRYSDSVSLSKILDCFLTDEEEPSVILGFLSEYDIRTVHDIFTYSMCLPRMFSLGFAYRCRDSELEKMLSYIKGIESEETNRICAYFLWQILRSGLSDLIKSKARKIVLDVSSRSMGKIRHPYSGIIGKRMSEYDYLFVEYPDGEGSVIQALGRMDILDFTEYVENLSHSLWFMRMFQIDVFESLDIRKQYAFVSGVFSSKSDILEFPSVYFTFFTQVMSSCIDVEMKKMMYEKIRTTGMMMAYYIERSNPESVKMLRECDSREETMMKMNLYGIDNYAKDIILYNLLRGDEDFLTWLYDACPDVIRDHFDISDLIESWKEKKND